MAREQDEQHEDEECSECSVFDIVIVFTDAVVAGDGRPSSDAICSAADVALHDGGPPYMMQMQHMQQMQMQMQMPTMGIPKMPPQPPPAPATSSRKISSQGSVYDDDSDSLEEVPGDVKMEAAKPIKLALLRNPKMRFGSTGFRHGELAKIDVRSASGGNAAKKIDKEKKKFGAKPKQCVAQQPPPDEPAGTKPG